MNTHRPLLLVACAALGMSLAPSSTLAQQGTGTLTVRMSDASTGASLSGKVVIAGIGKRLSLTQSGSTELESIAAGTHRVRCLHPGYAAQVEKIVVKAGMTATVHCQMGRQARSDKAEHEGRKKYAPRVPVGKASIDGLGTMSRATGGIGYGLGAASVSARSSRPRPVPTSRPIMIAAESEPDFNTENYKHIDENPFHTPTDKPLSTFSIDVDTASYSNIRRFLDRSQLPPSDAVKIEELLNYFSYDDPSPTGETPFSVTTEVASSPWNDSHKLVRIGIRGRDVATDKMPPSNLVFLMDVSGSMNSPDKLPLLKAAFRLLVDNLRPQDRVAIVVYAGAAGVVLPSTSGVRKRDILAAIDSLSAGGSTAGGAGIELAYKIAQQNFIKGGNNRVILATDGDFNVGTSSEGDLVRLIEKKRKTGTFLTVLGFGSGNYQDAKMEQLADKGNGNHAYIDSILEAKKVLVTEMGGTLLTIAKDVKIQVELNPAKVKAYRLIGYENRKLAARDFNDDTKDAGELGAGHSLTALYEVIPAGSSEPVAGVDELKYQKRAATVASASNELMTVKLRYKAPNGETSKLVSQPVAESSTNAAKASNNLRFAAAVAEFGMLLRQSEHKGNSSYASVLSLAKGAMGHDSEGYRREFISLVEKAKLLSR